MPTVARIDRGGPASLGDAQAIKTIAEIARQEPTPSRSRGPTT